MQVARWFRRSDEERAPAPVGAAAPVAPPARERAPDSDAVLGTVLDTVNTLMQAIGGCAVDTDTTSAADAKQRTDRWRRHLMLGLAHPTAENEKGDEPGRLGVALHERDWRGAARYALDLRQGEQAWLTRTVADLRESVWTLLHGLHDVVGAVGRAPSPTSHASAQADEGAPPPPCQRQSR